MFVASIEKIGRRYNKKNIKKELLSIKSIESIKINRKHFQVLLNRPNKIEKSIISVEKNTQHNTRRKVDGSQVTDCL